MAGFGEPKKNRKDAHQSINYIDGEALYKIALDYHLRGDLLNAENAYRGALKNGFLHVKMFLNLGLICKNSKRIEQAIDFYKKAIELRPDDPDAYINLGNLFREIGQLDQALLLSLQSIELSPDNAVAHMNLGGIYKDLGQLDEAFLSTRKSLELNPDNAVAHMNLGGIYKDLGELEQALAATLWSLELKSDNPNALMNLGSIYQDLSQLDQALVATLKSLQLKPDNAIAHMNLGGIYRDRGQLDQALAATLRSLELKPDNAIAHMNLGGIYRDLGQLDQVIASTLKSLELKPDNPSAHMNLGRIYQDLGQLDQALAATLRSLELKPDNPFAHMNLGRIHQDLGQLDQGLVSTLQSLELKPDNPGAHMNLVSIYQAMGDIEKSVESLNNAYAINPHYPGALYHSSTILEDDKSVYPIQKKIEPIDQNSLSHGDRVMIQFAKSNCFHQLKDYGNASNCLKKANDLKLLYMPSNAAAFIEIIQSTVDFSIINKDSTDEQFCEQIFIVGIPRSGSTLLSAILNTNALVRDLGESTALPNAIRAFLNQGRIGKKQNLGHFYADSFDQLIPSGYITVDKQLYNFMHCHFIANYMPKAKIIHATRNPLDHILSMLRANLKVGNNYTSSIEDSAMVIIEQERLMRSFKQIFPHKIYTMSYERLVNKPEDETKMLFAWLGLEWNESCLHFHKNRQIINTASVMQVRQPISNKSVGGWKNYSSLLEPARKLFRESDLFLEESFNH